MSWQKKYYYSFKDPNNKKYTVEIWEDSSSVITAEEIRGDYNPATINYPTTDLFDPIKASVAELNLLSTLGLMYFDLYTNDMLKYQVRIYYEYWITPSVSTDLPLWFGYIDAENYSEPFNSIDNYPVTVTANDGFNVLNRIQYADYNPATNSYIAFKGVNSAWVVLQRILQKLNLPWTYIYIGLSSSPIEVTIGEDENLFEYVYVNNENYYNEDSDPESCRTVLNELLRPFGAFIIQHNSDLYITDINYIASGEMAFKKYEYVFEATSYLVTVSIDTSIGDISALGLEDTNITLEVDNGINRQTALYNLYAESKIVEYEAGNDFSSEGTTTTIGASGYQWNETEFGASSIWDKYGYGHFCKLAGIDPDNSKESANYLKISNQGLTGFQYYNQIGDDTKHTFSYKLKLPYLISSTNYYLRIEMQVYIRTIDDLGGTPTLGVKAACLTTRLKIGDKKYTSGAFYPSSTYSYWVDTTSSLDLILFFRDNVNSYDNNPINDSWISLDYKRLYTYYKDGAWHEATKSTPFLIPLTQSQGDVEFDIYGYRVYDESTDIWTEIEVKDFRIKNLKITITDRDGNPYDLSDLEYVSELDANFNNKGEDIKLYHGTNATSYPLQRGNVLGLNASTGLYQPLTGFNKAGDTDIIENLLLRSVKSNKGSANIRLNCSLPPVSPIGYITYSTYLTGKKFMPVSNKIDLSNGISSLTIREIHADDAVIL